MENETYIDETEALSRLRSRSRYRDQSPTENSCAVVVILYLRLLPTDTFADDKVPLSFFSRPLTFIVVIMRQATFLVACWAGLTAAHGHIREYVIDGNTYPAFDPAYDHDPKYGVKRIEWGFPKGKGQVGPVENVASLDVNCRYRPLKEPAIEAIARAGSNITFKWLDWFESHKGPVLTVNICFILLKRMVLTVRSTWDFSRNPVKQKMSNSSRSMKQLTTRKRYPGARIG